MHKFRSPGEERRAKRREQDIKRRADNPWRRLYKTRRWKWLREQRLADEPWCRMCKAHGKLVGANTVDHINAHKGDEDMFFQYENTQSLCGTCHNSIKQSEERLGYSKEVDLNGWPVDPRHPANQEPHAEALKDWAKG